MSSIVVLVAGGLLTLAFRPRPEDPQTNDAVLPSRRGGGGRRAEIAETNAPSPGRKAEAEERKASAMRQWRSRTVLAETTIVDSNEDEDGGDASPTGRHDHARTLVATARRPTTPTARVPAGIPGSPEQPDSR